ncbi:hypothetical protein ACN38_g5386 [Penicillium nordicum]|uniref:Uncharacterized protein n=1 Tax=Penicillium nordicum TaxID=229535 RepID=A0A0M9WG84_9EURO|nr:hypothetical protein ACN38_g5386 [Penicillium nordicum]
MRPRYCAGASSPTVDRYASHPKTHNKSPSRKLADGKGGCLEDSSNHEDQAGAPYRPTTTKSIGSETSSNRANQSTTTCEGCHHFLFTRAKNMAER